MSLSWFGWFGATPQPHHRPNWDLRLSVGFDLVAVKSCSGLVSGFCDSEIFMGAGLGFVEGFRRADIRDGVGWFKV